MHPAAGKRHCGIAPGCYPHDALLLQGKTAGGVEWTTVTAQHRRQRRSVND